ncbi:MAG: type IVB secretion system protein IcmH/DotU [Pseudomonadota bacterium]
MTVSPSASTPASTARAPSLFAGGAPGSAPMAARAATLDAHTLLDVMYDGFYLVFLLRQRQAPRDAAEFRERIKDFLMEFERGALRLKADAEDVHLAKYAFCALVDETVLSSSFRVRDAWERQPLQLQFFGDQLAGEHFFDKLEAVRAQGARRLQVLEVFHMCLLLGFQGKYLLEGSEKLGYYTARLGDEIAHLKGKRAPFAPHWAAPDKVIHALRHEVPLWAVASVVALFGLTAFIGLRWQLGRTTQGDLAAYQDVVKLPPRAAHITITLP